MSDPVLTVNERPADSDWLLYKDTQYAEDTGWSIQRNNVLAGHIKYGIGSKKFHAYCPWKSINGGTFIGSYDTLVEATDAVKKIASMMTLGV